MLNLQKITEPIPLNNLQGRFFDGRIFSSPLERKLSIKRGQIEGFKDPESKSDLIVPSKTLIIPGGIDLHVHGREVYDILPDKEGDQTYKEDSYTLSLALAHGGATTAMCMPNLANNVCSEDEYKKQLAWINNEQPHRKKPISELLMYTLIKPGSEPQVPQAMYKLMWNTFGPTNFNSDEEVRETLKKYEDCWVTAHCETISGMVQGEGLAHHEQRPKQAAIDAVRLFLDCAKKYRFHPHIAHISSAEEVELVKEARRRGVPATCEITPQATMLAHDTFTAKTGFPTIMCQQNPPLRSEAERQELLSQIKDIDIFATDHAPHTYEEKMRGMSGMPQADSAGQVYLELVSEDIISLRRYIEMRSEIPGNILHEHQSIRGGKFKPLYDASFTLVTLGKPSNITRGDVLSKCRWTPYNEIEFRNTIEGVVIKGTLYTAATLKKLKESV